MISKGKKTYYEYDGRGSVSDLVDRNGRVFMYYQYSAFGETTIKYRGFVRNQYRYNAEYVDWVPGIPDFQYLRARYYTPHEGMFSSQDTVFGDVRNPLTQNLYIYTTNNPVMYQDPSGHGLSEIMGLEEARDRLEREMYEKISNAPSSYEQKQIMADYQNQISNYDRYLRFQKGQETSIDRKIRWAKDENVIKTCSDGSTESIEIFSNKQIMNEIAKFNGLPITINLSKTSFEYGNGKINPNSQFYGCVNKAPSTYTDEKTGLMRVKIGEERDEVNDYYALALVETYLKDAHNALADLGIKKEHYTYYGGYKFKITLADQDNKQYTLNAVSFDVKAAQKGSISPYFPKDGLGTGHHDHVVEFIFQSNEAKKNAENNILTGGNVDLGKLLKSNEPLYVYSVSAYIDKPLVEGDYKMGYKEK